MAAASVLDKEVRIVLSVFHQKSKLRIVRFVSIRVYILYGSKVRRYNYTYVYDTKMAMGPPDVVLK